MAQDDPYREAEKKIEEARLSGAAELHLGSMQLTVLPESLGQLGQLKTLNLSDNKLTSLPEFLGHLTQLQSLYLAKNRLASLPDSLGQLMQLHLLSLRSNRFSALPEWLCGLTQLQSLNLRLNPLKSLPDSLGALTRLQELILQSTQLISVPEFLGQLTRLHALNLSKNKLTSLSESLGRLTQLQLLLLQGNRLTALPEFLGQLTHLKSLYLASNRLTSLPESLGQLTQLRSLGLGANRLTAVPESLGQLTQLRALNLAGNQLASFPESLGQLAQLEKLDLARNQLRVLPESLGQLRQLQSLCLSKNRLRSLPASLGQLTQLTRLDLDNNFLNPELDAAYKEGLDAVKRYLRAKADAQVALNEAKLILIGEGEVGKSCLLGALRGDPWEEGRPTTHGIEIKPVKVIDPDSGTEITLNGWDFGGQRVYRPTHQLFFSSPAVYLVVWKPREGSQAGAVKEWIKLVKHREPDAKILVVATHGGPKERQPDIGQHEIRELFGKDMVLCFLSVESRPSVHDEATGEWTGERVGIQELKDAIARVAAGLPEMGREVPKRWEEARGALLSMLSLDAVGAMLHGLVSDEEEARGRLTEVDENDLSLEGVLAILSDLILDEDKASEKLMEARLAYLPLKDVLALCADHKMEEDEAGDFVRISHRLGHLIHYEHDELLRDIVVLKPDWLTTAISFVFDDKETRDSHGLVSFERLGQLWHDEGRPEEDRYPAELHLAFLRLMERFDLSYRIAEPHHAGDDGTSLIAQLVSDVRPEEDLGRVWPDTPEAGDEQQVQICQIVEAKNGQSANAEGLFFQLIVRLHKYSLGRVDHHDSVHWQRGLVLDDDYNGRALLEHVGYDVRITVRAPYPERFLSVLTHEVKWLVESFWEGLHCDVMVPCIEPCGKAKAGTALFDVDKLMASKKRGRPEYPCNVCDEWQDINALLRNAPAARRIPAEQLLAESAAMKAQLAGVRELLAGQQDKVMGRFDVLDRSAQTVLSKVDDAFTGLMQALTDEAKEGPRLFSFEPAETGFFDRPKWVSAKFRLILWCEHSRQPLPALNGEDDGNGVYELDIPRDWFVKAAPWLKVLATTLSLVAPVASSATKLVMDDAAYKGIEKQLDLGLKSVDTVLKGGEKVGGWLGQSDGPDVERGEGIRAQGAVLRQLHVWLKEKDPGFGGLVRVRNKREEFLWVHRRFEGEY